MRPADSQVFDYNLNDPKYKTIYQQQNQPNNFLSPGQPPQPKLA